MTPKEQVLKKFPKAQAQFFAAASGFPKDIWDIYQNDDDGALCLGSGASEEAAWIDATRLTESRA